MQSFDPAKVPQIWPDRAFFSRSITGPVESVSPHDRVLISGELLVPQLRPSNSPWYEFEPKRLAYRFEVHGYEWRDAETRNYLESRARYLLLKELLDRFTLPMRAEVVS